MPAPARLRHLQFLRIRGLNLTSLSCWCTGTYDRECSRVQRCIAAKEDTSRDMDIHTHAKLLSSDPKLQRTRLQKTSPSCLVWVHPAIDCDHFVRHICGIDHPQHSLGDLLGPSESAHWQPYSCISVFVLRGNDHTTVLNWRANTHSAPAFSPSLRCPDCPTWPCP